MSTDLREAAQALLDELDAELALPGPAVHYAPQVQSLRAALAADDGMVQVPREPSETMIDAPRQIILYAEARGRTLEGLRAHLVQAGVDYLSWAPVWATREVGHLTKGAIAILVYRAMLAAAQEGKS